eukprot:121066-Chlamydomonas_euryale.AAC.3
MAARLRAPRTSCGWVRPRSWRAGGRLPHPSATRHANPAPMPANECAQWLPRRKMRRCVPQATRWVATGCQGSFGCGRAECVERIAA